MGPNPQYPADLVTFTEYILNGKLHFSWSVKKHSSTIPLVHLLENFRCKVLIILASKIEVSILPDWYVSKAPVSTRDPRQFLLLYYANLSKLINFFSH